jgi:hypothetical protein
MPSNRHQQRISGETADINHVDAAGGMMAMARCRESTSVRIGARSSSSSKHAAAALARAKRAGEPRQCDTAHTFECNVSGSFSSAISGRGRRDRAVVRSAQSGESNNVMAGTLARGVLKISC